MNRKQSPEHVALSSQISEHGFTMSPNGLDDLLLAIAPDPYYRVWRAIWRATFGWKQASAVISMKTLAERARVRRNDASRAATVFDLVGLITYRPGRMGTLGSDITVLPKGLPSADDLRRIERAFVAIERVEELERRHRRARAGELPNNQFRAAVHLMWNAQGPTQYMRARKTIREMIAAVPAVGTGNSNAVPTVGTGEIRHPVPTVDTVKAFTVPTVGTS